MILAKIPVSLSPVFCFLAALIFLDSYKLVRLTSVVRTIIIGSAGAVVCLLINRILLEYIGVSTSTYTRYFSPVAEELVKAAFVIYLFRTARVGFMVDAAIHGFAVGAGFAFAENLYYLYSLESANVLLWIIRGFGTAIMHGGTMSIFGVVSKDMTDRHPSGGFWMYLPGLVIAVVFHSVFNHFIFSPLVSTVVLLVGLPLLFMIVFKISEDATRKWLGVGMDADIELLEIINTGRISETRIGRYLDSLKARFPGPVVADMLCFLRLHLELSLRAKGILLSRQFGCDITSDPEVRAKFEELGYLEKSIGKTGRLAILPFLRIGSRDLWQIYMLRNK
ncbi:MAG: PrsW family intramembrane metalloprotease [Candidatus Zixiibacteriota bacterium]|nr:MAG: PrsW family intramembrane metalloprotease [candidate division Zixibacteria bacterium]